MILRRRMLLLFFATAIAACGPPLGPYPLDEAPQDLEFHFSGFGGPWVRVVLDGDSIAVYRGTWSSPTLDSVRVAPTAEEWRQFWYALDVSGVHRWRANYINRDMADGVGWSVAYEHLDVRRESMGANRYPRADGSSSDDDTADFRRVVKAFETLSGVPFGLYESPRVIGAGDGAFARVR